MVSRQTIDLKRKATIDEIAFGIFSVALLLVLYNSNTQFSLGCLLLLFVGYKIID